MLDWICGHLGTKRWVRHTSGCVCEGVIKVTHLEYGLLLYGLPQVRVTERVKKKSY